ncbi:sugar phosphate isomerase/epimerase [Catenulispora sp. GAS73]|uniref:sugar phosphate isomerase/epimerase family protein n=1 Tax=Catenulispora sp. GAS73 TaxID=3156269 RepID=UPI003516F927
MTRNPSVQLYSVRDHLTDSTQRESTLKRLADIGFTAVEPYDPTNDPAGFRALADDLGLSVSGAHAMALLREPDPAPVFEALATIGTDLAILPAGIPEDDFKTHDGLKHAADTLNALAAKAAEAGLRFGYHNHYWEFEPVLDGRHALEILVDLVDPAVVFEIDTYWSTVGGADTPAVLERLGERVVALHVKDGPTVKGEPNVAVGTGAMPVPAVLAAAPRDAWRVIEFDECATDIFEALAASLAYVNGLEAA